MSPIGDWLAEAQQADFTGRQAQLDLFRALLPLDRQKALSELGEDARQRIQSLISLKRLASLIVLGIHGIGGIGKSRLLAQFQALAEEYNEESDRLRRDEPVLVARLDLQSHKGILDFLTAIYEQLAPRMEFPSFEAGLKLRQEIEDRLRKSENIPKGALQTLSRGVSSLIKGIPFIGEPIAEMLASPEQVEAAISTIYGVVGRKEGDFWMKPEEELADRLIADLQPLSEKYRFVLMFDTYELIGTFDEWVRERLLPRLGERTLIVIAGRYPLEGRGWQRYSTLMWQLELPLFSHDESRQYLEKKGVTDMQVTTSLAERTDGHPLILSMFAELAAQGEVKGIDMTRSAEGKKVIQQLLKSIKERVAENLQTALEICAVLRVVNEDSLAFMLDQYDVAAIFDQVRAFDFVKVRSNGIALHDTVWAAMNEELSWRSPSHYRELNAKAAQFYEQALAEGNATEWDNYELERLYHYIRADEVEGVTLFEAMAERFVRYHLVNRLNTLLSDVANYSRQLRLENSKQWLRYYEARLAQLQVRMEEAIRTFENIGDDDKIEPRLRAYALSALGAIRQSVAFLGEPQGFEKLIEIVSRSNSLLQSSDPTRLTNLLSLAGAYWRTGAIEKAHTELEEAITLYRQSNDWYGLANAYIHMMGFCAVTGQWRRMYAARKEALQLFPAEFKHSKRYGDLMGHFSVAWAWSGRCREGEQNIRANMALKQQLDEIDFIGANRDLSFCLGLQNRYDEAKQYLTTALEDHMDLLGHGDRITLGFGGAILLREGDLDGAKEYLEQSWLIKTKVHDLGGLPELLTWFAQIEELRFQWSTAEGYYSQYSDYLSMQRRYWTCSLLTGFNRVKHAQQQYNAIPSLLTEAEQLAQQYEYNDHLTSLRLTQGHIAWDGHIEEWGRGFEVALGYYKQALVYALRFNRFLLDEALSGRERGTPLRAIIPHCLERVEEGHMMLEALAEWWRTGTNDIGSPRPDTISPIPEGIPLLEAERIARSREPGDGFPQRTVLEQIESALPQRNPTA